MDWLTFISKITESLAWPIVALILGILLKKRLLEIIPNMKRFKAGTLEAEFELATKQVLADASEASAATKSQTAGPEQSPEKTAESIVSELLSAKTDPSGMIIEGWGKVDGELHRFGRQLGIIDDPLKNTARVYNTIINSNELPYGTVEVVKELRELRNKVAHALVTPTADAAQNYLVAVDRVVELIRNFRKNVPNYGPDNR